MATSKKITPFKLKKSSNEHCGKSAVDGSYVKGSFTNYGGVYKINDVPVHPWSVGIIVSKVEYNPSG